ncbi:hypothetical protein OFB80_35500, partial [Escherichia coli]|nr:hypothetical protein [Escherichia coli]
VNFLKEEARFPAMWDVRSLKKTETILSGRKNFSIRKCPGGADGCHIIYAYDFADKTTCRRSIRRNRLPFIQRTALV